MLVTLHKLGDLSIRVVHDVVGQPAGAVATMLSKHMRTESFIVRSIP